MIPYIQNTKPVHRRLRIKNRIRLTIFLLLILWTCLAIFIHHIQADNTTYKPLTVAYGDTYWGIAKDLQEQGYKPNKDIRAIVNELVTKSGIKAHELKEGDIIYLPDLEGVR